jgi:iron complex outermembrane receptor protein
MLRIHHASRAVLMASAALVAAQASAQTADAATAADHGASLQTTKTEDGSIIVTAKHYVPTGSMTASKTDIPLIQTPQSISVITRDQIDLLNFIDAQQAVRYTAGVFGENYGSDPRYDFITVRGFTPKQFIDGLAVPATTTIQSTGVDLYAFESLDILKGPSSTLYGSAPPGGILNETSRRPSDVFGGEIEGKYGTHDFGEIATTVTGPATDFLDVRMTALYRDADSEIKHTNTKRLLAAPSATLKLGPDTKLTALAYYQYDDDTGGAGGFLPASGTLLANPNGKLSRSTNLDDPQDEYIRRQYGVGYDFEQKFGDTIAFHSNTKWSRYSEHTPIGLYSTQDYSSASGFIVVDPANPADPANFRQLYRSNFTYAERVNSFATDNRFDATVATGPVTQKLLAGLDYRDVHNVAADNFVSAGTIDIFAPTYPASAEQTVGYPGAYNDERLKQTGVYGQDQIAFDRLYLTLNGRYDWAHLSDSYFGAAVQSEKEHKFTYRAGLSYVTDAGIAPYISYGTSFEPQLGTDRNTLRPLGPTSVKQWEGGVKYDGRALPDDFKIFATAAAFDIKEKNFVVAEVGITPVNNAVQGGLVEVYGGELELVARIRQQFSLNGAFSYTHSEIKSSPNSPADIGAPLPTTPKYKASLFANYDIQHGALGGLGFGFGARYNGRSAGSLPSAYGVVYEGQAATLFDAIVSYDMPHWRLAVNGSNIFDKNYVARCDGPFNCVYGAGRQVIGTATYKF